MNSYTNGQFHEGARGVTVSDKAARYKHCVIDNGNGTLTTTIAQPNGRTVSRTVTGNIPDGDIRVQFGDDNYNPDKHFDAKRSGSQTQLVCTRGTGTTSRSTPTKDNSDCPRARDLVAR